MHRIAYETIIENDRKNWNEPLEFTINAINDRQYIDLYNSYITFDLYFTVDGSHDSSVFVSTRTTQAGIIEQANISNLIYFEGDTIKNAVFDSIRNAPDYRSMIAYLFNNRIELKDLIDNKDIRELDDTRNDPVRLCDEVVTFARQTEETMIGLETETLYSINVKIPCKHLFELANEPNLIHYKEISFKLFFKDPHRYLVNTSGYISDETDAPLPDYKTTSIGYNNVTFAYHYYEDIEIEHPLTLKNNPLQSFTFQLKSNDVDTEIKKSLLMNDVYRYLMIYCTANNESSRVCYEFPTKITLAQQGRAFWSINLPYNDPRSKEESKRKLWDLTSYCINKPGQPASVINWSTHSWTYYIYVIPIDEIIDYEAPGYLDFNISLHNEDDPYYFNRQLHLVFFGK